MCTGVEVLSLVAGGFQAASAISQGNAANAAGKTQAALLQRQAERERQIAAQDEESYRREQSRVMAARRALMGAAGVDAGAGSPLLVSEDMAGEAELQALKIRNNGEAVSSRLMSDAVLARAEGKNARNAGYFRAGASLLQGAGNAFGR